MNLLGVQFALCECSKYFFYVEFESGTQYKPCAYVRRIPEDDVQPEALRLSLHYSELCEHVWSTR